MDHRKAYRTKLTLLALFLLIACSEQIRLTRQQALSNTVQEIRQQNTTARMYLQDKKYQLAIKHWYKVINLANQFNRAYPSRRATTSFLNDKTAAYYNIGNAHYDSAAANNDNLNMYKDALQSFLLCLQYQPENIKVYNDGIRTAKKLNDVARLSRLREWKAETIRIRDEYSFRARQIDAKYPSRSPDNQPRNREFLELYKWAYGAASEAGVTVLAERYRVSLENYEKLTAN
jgi:tetratricopeptide (TPR) repeat protein